MKINSETGIADNKPAKALGVISGDPLCLERRIDG
jgi:hypothetical protein